MLDGVSVRLHVVLQKLLGKYEMCVVLIHFCILLHFVHIIILGSVASTEPHAAVLVVPEPGLVGARSAE